VFFINRDIRYAFFVDSKGLNENTIDLVIEQVRNADEVIGAFSLDFFYKKFVFEDPKRKDMLENDVMNMIRTEYTKYLLHYQIDKYLLTNEESNQLSVLVKRNDFKSKLITKLFSKVKLFLEKHYFAMDNDNFLPSTSYDYIYTSLSYSLSVGYERILERFVSQKYKFLYDQLKSFDFSFNLEDFVRMYNFVSIQLDQNLDIYRPSIDDYFGKQGLKTQNNINWMIEKYCLGNVDLLAEVFNELFKIEVNGTKFFSLTINYLNNTHRKEMSSLLIDKILSLFTAKHSITDAIIKPLVFYSKKHREFLSKFMVNEIIESSSINDDAKELILYPINNQGYEVYYESGKIIFLQFLKNLFQESANEFYLLFMNPDTILRDLEIDKERTRYELKSRSFYDLIRSFWRNTPNSELLIELCPNFYDDSISIARFFVTIGVFKLLNMKVENILFDSLTQLFQLVSHRYHIKMIDSFYIDNRMDKEQNLIRVVNRYGVIPTITDDYFSSMIDNEVATVEQIDRFPILEQVGDAIYELCVSQLLLKDLDIQDANQFTLKRNDLVKAPLQLEIADKIGLNECYIHNKFLEEKFKMDFYEKIISDMPDIDNHYDKKTYLADALEMLIGSVYFDQGIDVAMQFTTKVLCDNNAYLSKLHDFVIPDHNRRFNLDWNEYVMYTRTYPQLTLLYSGQYSVHESLGYTLSKLLSILVYGNETKEKRSQLRRISYNHELSITKIVKSNSYLSYFYLNEGFTKAKEVYEKDILPIILKEAHFD